MAYEKSVPKIYEPNHSTFQWDDQQCNVFFKNGEHRGVTLKEMKPEEQDIIQQAEAIKLKYALAIEGFTVNLAEEVSNIAVKTEALTAVKEIEK